MKRRAKIQGILALLAVAAATGPTAAEESRAARVASAQLAGTLLVVEPRIDFVEAHLRVAGPGGYYARQAFAPSSQLTLDLLAAGMMPAPPAPGGIPQIDIAPQQGLPDGQYRWEAIFERVGEMARVNGSFFLRSGTPSAQPFPENGVAPGAGADTEPAEPVPAATESEILILTDDNNNGRTLVELQANDSSGNRLENWQIQNSQGDFHIVEDGSGSQNAVRFTIVQDDDGKVGIGTTAPERSLHILGEFPSILLDHIAASGSSLWRITGGPVVFSVTPGNITPFVIWKDSPPSSLVVHPEGVGIGVSSPAHKLHVGGDTRLGGDTSVHGDLSVLSSKDAKESFVPVDSQTILARVAELPILEWSYKGEGATRHLGPTAEDFRAAFALGKSAKSVNPLDVSGVALAAIQGLAQSLAELRAETERLRERLAGLERSLEAGN